MARQRKTQLELAETLRVNAHTAGRRIRGEVPFDVVELEAIAIWLDVPVAQLWPNGLAAASA
jgi:transcriptional regulator with XRE-family HTH domain